MSNQEREETIEELEALKQKTEKFIGDIFDWVRCLDSIYILQHIGDFQQQIENKITELKNVPDTDEG